MLSHGSQSENSICTQNFHVEANEKIMLATEDANTWEEIEVSPTTMEAARQCAKYRKEWRALVHK